MPVTVTTTRPLSARSIVLSCLLGAATPTMSGADILSLGSLYGVSNATMRVALSRMTSAGDLTVDGRLYSLSVRHLDRRARIERRIRPHVREYAGVWRMGVVTRRGRHAEERMALRETLAELRLAELREGVWIRPDNIADLELSELAVLDEFSVTPTDDIELARRLWDVDGWLEAARAITLRLTAAVDPLERLTTAAEAVRQLCADPVLPEELAPTREAARALLEAYERFQRDLQRDHARVIESRGQ